ncbi:MAG: hypothetical protein IAF94_03380, partial [Pirellulaceae bacterium]|nr:hypothetical protein [Pirellulaceae bacterium]
MKPITIPLPTPATPLAEFIEHWYMTVAHGVRHTPPGLHTRYKMETFVGMVTIHLHRPPLLSDLTLANLESLKETWAKQGRGKVVREVQESMFVSVWRFAADLKVLRDAPPRCSQLRLQLSEDEGTLWHICKTKYIPTNVRVQSVNTIAH